MFRFLCTIFAGLVFVSSATASTSSERRVECREKVLRPAMAACRGRKMNTDGGEACRAAAKESVRPQMQECMRGRLLSN